MHEGLDTLVQDRMDPATGLQRAARGLATGKIAIEPWERLLDSKTTSVRHYPQCALLVEMLLLSELRPRFPELVAAARQPPVGGLGAARLTRVLGMDLRRLTAAWRAWVAGRVGSPPVPPTP